jgi:hypothetical protein
MHDSHPNLQLKTSKDEKMGRFNQKNHPWQKKIKKNIHWLNATFILKIVCYHFWHGLMVGENIGHIF